MNREDAQIPSGDSYIAAWVYRPATLSGTCVVMAHGFSLTRHDGLEPFAEAFVDAGATVVCFDHRYLGDSGGEPRQRFRASAQLADWRAAIAYARGLEGVDRVVLWGYSFSGGHCATLAAGDTKPDAMLLLCPFADGLGRVRSTPLPLIAWITPHAVADLAGRHCTIPVTGPVGSHAAMPLADEEEGFAIAVADNSPWRNAISPAVFLTVAFHRPWAKAANLRMPVFVGMGDRDISVPAKGIHRLVDRAPDATLKRYDADHFTVFAPPLQEQIIADQVGFLRERGFL
ncbi:alpha/beta fold hydrolase [Mycolicibacterium sp.]|uniref:alpha/beta hydrolase n=1 Tax=Mycolicibacterium sp. TaxID=2320850 RepID=UPI0025F149E6|nr:alpha/beta fold hydrolase [Mycolicibacterium sp.]